MIVREPGQISELNLGKSDLYQEKTEHNLTLNVAESNPKLECWTELKVKDKFITKRSYHASVLYNSRLYVYGGQDLNVGIYSDFNSVELSEDLTLSCWETVNTTGQVAPGPLSRAATVLDGDRWYIFGGTSSALCNHNDLWCFNFSKREWSLIEPSSGLSPPPLDSCSASLYKNEQGRSYIVIFGGFVGGTRGEYWNQVIMFDISNQKWLLPYSSDDELEYENPRGPVPRCGHSALIHKNRMYIFAGTNGELRLNDCWYYDLNHKDWYQVHVRDNPPPRSHHTAVVYNNEGMLIFGGIQDITHERDDILFFSFLESKWTILDSEADFAKRSTTHIERTPSPDKLLEMQKIERSNRGKSFTESPGRKGTRNSRNNTFILGSPQKKNSSPGQSSKKLNRLQTNDSFTLTGTDMRKSGSPNMTGSRGYQGLSKENEEKRRRLFLVKKTNFLKEFDVTDPQDILDLTLKSPTAEAMKNSIVALNYKGKSENERQTETGSQSPFKGKKKAVTNFSGLFGDYYLKVKIPINGKLTGRKPCARDGHTALAFGHKMIVFGGDRHKMSFNDIYVLNMKQLIAPKDRDLY